MEIRNVLVAFDFSPPSTLALNHAVALARRFRARLSILHVIESSTAAVYAFPSGVEKLNAERIRQAERLLPALINPEDHDDLEVRFFIKKGEIAEELLEAVNEVRPDIVVVGTHGRGLFGRMLIGSVTQNLLRKLSVPILTVCHAGRPLEFRRILLATDLVDVSDEAFRFALELASKTDATLIVTHVVDTRPGVALEPPEVKAVFEEERQIDAKQARVKFAEFETEGNRRKVKVETVLAEGVPSEAIIRMADETMADMIIVQVRKRGRLDRTLFGSTAEPVIREAHVPVLSVPFPS